MIFFTQLFISTLFFYPNIGQSESPITYCDRGNRMEGAKDIWETSGAHTDFGEVYIECADLPLIDSSNFVQLRSYMTDSIAMEIMV